MALMAITGALRTSATEMLEVHANLLPTELLFHKICHRAAVRLSALPETYPLHKPVCQSACHNLKRHRSTLHQLLHAFRIHPPDYEVIGMSDRPPNKGNSFIMEIASSRADLKEDDAMDMADICAYSDGSGLDGKAGAGAVVFRGSCLVGSVRYCLSPLTCHTTYEAEVVGVLLALELIHRERRRSNTVSLKLDNQAVICALNNCR